MYGVVCGCAGNAENATRHTIAKYDGVPRPRVAYSDHIGISRWGLGSNAELAINREGMQFASVFQRHRSLETAIKLLIVQKKNRSDLKEEKNHDAQSSRIVSSKSHKKYVYAEKHSFPPSLSIAVTPGIFSLQMKLNPKILYNW